MHAITILVETTTGNLRDIENAVSGLVSRAALESSVITQVYDITVDRHDEEEYLEPFKTSIKHGAPDDNIFHRPAATRGPRAI